MGKLEVSKEVEPPLAPAASIFTLFTQLGTIQY